MDARVSSTGPSYLLSPSRQPLDDGVFIGSLRVKAVWPCERLEGRCHGDVVC